MKKNIIKVKRFHKPLICLIGILLVLLGIVIDRFMSANADEINYEYQSSGIGYDSTNNSLNATNVKDAIDELYAKVGQCPTGYECLLTTDIVENDSSNIIKAYTYDENSCITGDETACKRTICYLSNSRNSCPVGTIVDYKVNNTNIIRFHVLHDDGNTLTMQAQRNTIYNVAWWSGSDDNTKGPQTIMTKLKEQTDSWTNVNPITITSETTIFTGVNSIDNLCVIDDGGNVICSGNKYDIVNIAGTYRTRMITTQEAADSNIGQCKSWVSSSKSNSKSCRMFMSNYLYDVKQSAYCRNVELCVEDDHTENGADHNWGYWTMNATTSFYAWNMRISGNLSSTATSKIINGARAVVVVNK